MQPAETRAILDKLNGLRTELVDLAFMLDGRGACEAADVAITTSARLAELCAEFAPQPASRHRTPSSKLMLDPHHAH
jgi:hypothetical protein